VTREGLRAALDAAVGFDASALLPAVEAPALVLHRREIPWLPLSIARGRAHATAYALTRGLVS
jgi:hypothetical protein